MSLVSSGLLLALLVEDVWRKGVSNEPADLAVEVFLFVGLSSTIVVSGHATATALSG